MKAFKLFKVRKDGSIGSLFINASRKLPLNEWLTSECYPTKGFALRPGWHCTHKPYAPHLSMKKRAWYKVDIQDFKAEKRPKSQGGLWYLANKIKIIGEVDDIKN